MDTKHTSLNCYLKRFDVSASDFEKIADYELSTVIQQWWASAFDRADKYPGMAYLYLSSYLHGACMATKSPLLQELIFLHGIAFELQLIDAIRNLINENTN